MKEYDATEQAYWNGYRKAVEDFEKSEKTEANPIEMTEAEIMKALECCCNVGCLICPYYNRSGLEMSCSDKLILDCLDLINRKNVENESLKKCLEAASNGLDRIAKELGVEL